MYCFECLRDDFEEPAAGICHHCGGGVCLKHLVETEVTVTKTVPLGREVPLPIKARRIFCRVCREALTQPK